MSYEMSLTHLLSPESFEHKISDTFPVVKDMVSIAFNSYVVRANLFHTFENTIVEKSSVKKVSH